MQRGKNLFEFSKIQTKKIMIFLGEFEDSISIILPCNKYEDLLDGHDNLRVEEG